MLNFLEAFARRRRKKSGNIEITSEGFKISRSQQAREIRWDAIIKIEVFRIPGFIVEDFCAVFFSNDDEPVVVDDIYPDFLKFQDAVWQQWPEIKDRWIAIYLGSPSQRERAVLWERQQA